MPAYYINSGQLRTKIVADTPKQACIQAFKKLLPPILEKDKELKLGWLVSVDEQGEKIKNNTLIMLTTVALKESGLAEKYQVDTIALDREFKKLGELEEDEEEEWWKNDE